MDINRDSAENWKMKQQVKHNFSRLHRLHSPGINKNIK